mmetsp:Transcript_36484/g.145854  ORF Transcript_36484/g.145854 Transcript_36484/m.145854 type:complete len:127 (-) Transcript_36484:832-1212(-)
MNSVFFTYKQTYASTLEHEASATQTSVFLTLILIHQHRHGNAGSPATQLCTGGHVKSHSAGGSTRSIIALALVATLARTTVTNTATANQIIVTLESMFGSVTLRAAAPNKIARSRNGTMPAAVEKK